MGAAVDKLLTYIFTGSLPFLDPSYAFNVPCLDVENSGDFGVDWDKYQLGKKGRYGHPLTIFTLLALSTPILRKDLKTHEFNCRVKSTDKTKTKSDLDNC